MGFWDIFRPTKAISPVTREDAIDSLYTKYGYYDNRTEFCNDCNKLIYKGIASGNSSDYCCCGDEKRTGTHKIK